MLLLLPPAGGGAAGGGRRAAAVAAAAAAAAVVVVVAVVMLWQQEFAKLIFAIPAGPAYRPCRKDVFIRLDQCLVESILCARNTTAD